jgi:MtN3 and saliva related transmembrane protein
MTDLLGLLAGALTTGCWLPQIVRSIRTRRMEDFSWAYLGLLAAGMLLWLVYGLARHDPVIVVTNGIALGLQLVLLALKCHGVPTTARGRRAMAYAQEHERHHLPNQDPANFS